MAGVFISPAIAVSLHNPVPIVIPNTPQKAPESLVEQVNRLSAEYHQDPDLALRIITCEGKLYGNKNNQNFDKDGNVWSTDIGPWQINNYFHEARANKMGFDIYNTSDNLEYGFILMKEQGTRPWLASSKCWS